MARMPKYEKIRSLYAGKAIAKPQQSKLWFFLNSSIFLWFLTATVLTAGGTLVSSYQECKKDAEDQIERFSKLSREIAQRRIHVKEIVLLSTTVSEMRTKLSQPYTYFPEFNGYPTRLLFEARIASMNRFGHFYVGHLPPGLDEIVSSAPNNKFPANFARIPTYGEMPWSVTEQHFKDLQAYASTITVPYFLPLVGYGVESYTPDCRPNKLIGRFFEPSTIIVRSDPGPRWRGVYPAAIPE